MDLNTEVLTITQGIEKIALHVVSNHESPETWQPMLNKLTKALKLLNVVCNESPASADDEYMFKSPQDTIVSMKTHIDKTQFDDTAPTTSTRRQRTVKLGGIKIQLPVVKHMDEIPTSFYFYEGGTHATLPRDLMQEMGETPPEFDRSPISQVDSIKNWRSQGPTEISPGTTPPRVGFQRHWQSRRRGSRSGQSYADAGTTRQQTNPPDGVYMRLVNSQIIRVVLPDVVNSSDENAKRGTIPCKHGSVIDCAHNKADTKQNMRSCEFVHFGEQYSICGSRSRGSRPTIGNPKTLDEDARWISPDETRRLLMQGSATLLAGSLCAARNNHLDFVETELAFRNDGDFMPLVENSEHD